MNIIGISGLAALCFYIATIVLYRNILNLGKASKITWIAICLAVFHLIFTLFYYLYSQSNIADSTFYYSQALENNGSWRLGTTGVIKFIEILNLVSASTLTELDTFIWFSVFGFVGHLFLFNTLSTIFKNYYKGYWIIQLLPGIHFWTASIGKDSIAFCGVTMILWATVSLQRRYVIAIIGVLFLLWVRPHIALISLITVIFASAFDTRIKIHLRFLIVIFTVTAAFYLYPLVLEYTRLGSLDNLAQYIENRQSSTQFTTSFIALHDVNIFKAMFGYLFRPMFLDSEGIFGIVASIENLVYLVTFLYFLTGGGLKMLYTHRNSFFIKSVCIFIILLLPILSTTTANLGIAMRQKTMLSPFFITLLVMLLNTKRANNITRRR